MGTSITEAKPSGYRPLTQDALRDANPSTKFMFGGFYWAGGKTWEILWNLAGMMGTQHAIVIDVIGTNDTQTGRSEIEALIRRIRSDSPNTRIVVLIQPTWNSNTDPTNVIASLNADTRALTIYYDATIVDWTQRVFDLLAAETYTQPQLYVDIVHPTSLGHSVLSEFLLETLNAEFISNNDAWTGNLADYVAQYDDGTFENTDNYIATNAIDGTITGTWTVINATERQSVVVDSSIEFSGMFQSWGFEMGTYNIACSIGITIDGGSESVVNLAPNRPFIRMGYLADGAHTIAIRVVSGTFHLKRFLAI